ncbi:MAG: DNA-directed RNA polymerase subunit L [Nitrososphaerota archaeon]|nr:DNA-directed RNA polymerase subunit L [Candidatus Bathyarchaeota archaeon]MDW8023818.1 DNA-directed RNA polymerase subunit L [Nitrososphaerota archaeon]
MSGGVEMKVKVLKKGENELKIEVEGAGHTLCNLLQKKLLEDEDVDLAGYDIPHPLASNPIIYVRTKGKETPEEALLKAVERVREMNKEFGTELQKALKT